MDEDLRSRYKVPRRDYGGLQTQPKAPAPQQPAPMPQPQPPKRPKKPRKLKKKLTYLIIILVLAAAGAGTWWFTTQRTTSPVPKNIQKSVNYKIYYPDPKKLPAGYYLDSSSFTNNSYAVLYAIKNGQNKVVVAVQPKPSADIIQNFNSKTLALHTTYQTSIGTATIGAIAPNSIVSLPTNSNVWIIVTAPGNIDQTQLEQVLSSLRT